jgi:hypothetical protein
MGLAEKSDFEQNLRKSRILFKTCAKVAFCSKLAQLLAEKSHFVQNFIKNATKGRK